MQEAEVLMGYQSSDLVQWIAEEAGDGGAKVRVSHHAMGNRQKWISTRSKMQHEHKRYPAMLQIIMVSQTCLLHR